MHVRALFQRSNCIWNTMGLAQRVVVVVTALVAIANEAASIRWHNALPQNLLDDPRLDLRGLITFDEFNDPEKSKRSEGVVSVNAVDLREVIYRIEIIVRAINPTYSLANELLPDHYWLIGINSTDPGDIEVCTTNATNGCKVLMEGDGEGGEWNMFYPIYDCSGLGLEAIPEDVPDCVRSIYLQNNSLSGTLNRTDFAKNTRLVLVDLRDNRIEAIGERAFENCRNLEVVDLSSNAVSAIHPKAFTANYYLIEIILTNNELSTLPENLEIPWTLVTLQLDYNYISDFDVIFDNDRSRNLRVLDIRDNRLAHLPSLAKLPFLIRLSVNRNSLGSIEDGAFNQNPYLSVLELSSNRLTELPNNIFMNNSNLIILDIGRNNLTSIDNMGAGAENLQMLFLEENDVAFVSDATFKNVLEGLTFISAGYNPLVDDEGCPDYSAKRNLSSSGLQMCVTCGAGYIFDAESNTCIPCASHTFKTDDGPGECAACPNGFYSPTGSTEDTQCQAPPCGAVCIVLACAYCILPIFIFIDSTFYTVSWFFRRMRLRRQEKVRERILEAIRLGKGGDPDTTVIRPQAIELIQQIGVGENGIVYRARFAGADVSVKYLRYRVQDIVDNDLAKKITHLRHPNIVFVIGVIKEDDGIVAEYCPHGSLEALLRTATFNLDWRQKADIAVNVARGLSYLHSLEIPLVHGSFATHCVLLGSGFVAKVTGFGLHKARPVGKKRRRSSSKGRRSSIVCENLGGQPGWTAPEVYTGNLNEDSQFLTAVDVFSFGVFLLDLSCRRALFASMGPDELRDKIVSGWRPDISADTPLEYMALIKSCWEAKPENRPTMSQVVDRLEAFYANARTTLIQQRQGLVKEDERPPSARRGTLSRFSFSGGMSPLLPFDRGDSMG